MPSLIDCLQGIDRDRYLECFEQRQQELKLNPPQRLFLVFKDEVEFLAGLGAAIAANVSVFLGNPYWRQQEWRQVGQLVQPDRVWGEESPLNKGGRGDHLDRDDTTQATIMIPTGGSSGQIRFAMHNAQTLTAAAQGFQAYFDVPQINSFCILPLYHVSGLMQVWRSHHTGGICQIGSYSQIKQGQWPELAFKSGFLSLVPTQLQQILSLGGAAWLQQFDTVLLGGAPAWPELLTQARAEKIRLALTYGMTETAAQVVTLQPEHFLAGNNTAGQVLPHAQVEITAEGRIAIKTRSRCLGYYPTPFPEPDIYLTDDRGQFDAQDYLTITGRESRKIITGGENVFPEVIEVLLRGTGQVEDVCVVGVPDDHWGEAIAVIYVPEPGCDRAVMQQFLAQQCSRFMQPRYWLPCDQLPRSPQGKIQYTEVQTWAQQEVAQGGD